MSYRGPRKMIDCYKRRETWWGRILQRGQGGSSRHSLERDKGAGTRERAEKGKHKAKPDLACPVGQVLPTSHLIKSAQPPYQAGTLIIPIFKKRKLRHGESQKPSQARQRVNGRPALASSCHPSPPPLQSHGSEQTSADPRHRGLCWGPRNSPAAHGGRGDGSLPEGNQGECGCFLWFNSTCWVTALDCLLATAARLQRPLTPGELERGREAEGSTHHAAAFPALFLFPSHSRKKRYSFIHSSIDFQAVWQLQELEI